MSRWASGCRTEDGFHLRTSQGEYLGGAARRDRGELVHADRGSAGAAAPRDAATRALVRRAVGIEELRRGAMSRLYLGAAPGEVVYGFPDLGEGFKMGLHEPGPICRPRFVGSYGDRSEVDAAQEIVGRCFPAVTVLRRRLRCACIPTRRRAFPDRSASEAAQHCAGRGRIGARVQVRERDRRDRRRLGDRRSVRARHRVVQCRSLVGAEASLVTEHRYAREAPR